MLPLTEFPLPEVGSLERLEPPQDDAEFLPMSMPHVPVPEKHTSSPPKLTTPISTPSHASSSHPVCAVGASRVGSTLIFWVGATQSGLGVQTGRPSSPRHCPLGISGVHALAPSSCPSAYASDRNIDRATAEEAGSAPEQSTGQDNH